MSLSAGESYVLNCTATGMPIPNVVWTKDGEEVPQTVRIMLIKNGDVVGKSWVGSTDGTLWVSVEFQWKQRGDDRGRVCRRHWPLQVRSKQWSRGSRWGVAH